MIQKKSLISYHRIYMTIKYSLVFYESDFKPIPLRISLKINKTNSLRILAQNYTILSCYKNIVFNK